MCPYPFDKSLNMIPFLEHCEIPKYDKYNAKSNPQDHINEFCSMSMEFAHNETYLMCLFPRSLSGQSMEWFSKLSFGIKSFEEIVNRFISQYSYNIKNEITMLDLYNIKQNNGEPFMVFLQRWRWLFNRYPRDVQNQEKMDIFIDSLTSEMSYRLKLKCPPSFAKLIENSLKIEDAMVKKGELKLYNNNNNGNNSNNNKPKFWMENKNVANEGVSHNNDVKPQQPIFNLSSREPVNNQENTKPKSFHSNPHGKFTNIWEPLE